MISKRDLFIYSWALVGSSCYAGGNDLKDQTVPTCVLLGFHPNRLGELVGVFELTNDGVERVVVDLPMNGERPITRIYDSSNQLIDIDQPIDRAASDGEIRRAHLRSGERLSFERVVYPYWGKVLVLAVSLEISNVRIDVCSKFVNDPQLIGYFPIDSERAEFVSACVSRVFSPMWRESIRKGRADSVSGLGPMQGAIAFGNDVALRELIRLGCDVNDSGDSNTHTISPLGCAVVHQRLDFIDLLLDAGADPSRVTVNGEWPTVSPRKLAMLMRDYKGCSSDVSDIFEGRAAKSPESGLKQKP